MTEPLIPPHGAYRELKSFQIARLIYDVTFLFCDKYIGRRSRTNDQMVQAARSGVQNIAEGSQASGTSRKTEIRLTNVARASLEELKLDFEDYLRQRRLEEWAPNHPALARFKARRCATLEDFRRWVKDERELALRAAADEHGRERADTDSSAPSSAQLAANGALSLLNLCCYLLSKQIAAQADAFEKEGGFTERLYRVRTERRRQGK